mgnify:CR=1 FL=1
MILSKWLNFMSGDFLPNIEIFEAKIGLKNRNFRQKFCPNMTQFRTDFQDWFSGPDFWTRGFYGFNYSETPNPKLKSKSEHETFKSDLENRNSKQLFLLTLVKDNFEFENELLLYFMFPYIISGGRFRLAIIFLRKNIGKNWTGNKFLPEKLDVRQLFSSPSFYTGFFNLKLSKNFDPTRTRREPAKFLKRSTRTRDTESRSTRTRPVLRR